MSRYRKKSGESKKKKAFVIGFMTEKENTDFKELIFMFTEYTSTGGIISDEKIKRMKNGNLRLRVGRKAYKYWFSEVDDVDDELKVMSHNYQWVTDVECSL